MSGTCFSLGEKVSSGAPLATRDTHREITQSQCATHTVNTHAMKQECRYVELG